MRTFLIARASALQLSDKTFKTPDDFSVDDYLWSSFGIWSKSGHHAIAIRIKSQLAEYVSENLWHPTQQVEALEGGDIIIRFELGSLEEISQWILSWGNLATVLEPPELRDLIKSKAKAIVELYD